MLLVNVVDYMSGSRAPSFLLPIPDFLDFLWAGGCSVVVVVVACRPVIYCSDMTVMVNESSHVETEFA